ncbi:ORC2-domain-containing protein [Aureobasidium pullulans]|uniref:Origin recognition complex subunit 2 n=1 Tax=Aureobasidium pullulans TaxID=5580 RepID=A0A4S9EXZ5_AURPU|nr:ORC2-domain-containing protein [Aureobasidium pullulans]
MPKRTRSQHEEDAVEDAQDADVETTPSKRRMTEAETPSRHTNADTPSKQRSILKSTLKQEGTPRSLRKVLFSTPARADEEFDDAPTKLSPLTVARNADRSARRKSHKRLFDAQDNDESVVDDTGLEDALARDILEDEDDPDADQEVKMTVTPGTPSKTARPRGRPKGSKKQPSPEAQDMAAHELYFFQNRPGGVKTSTNTLPGNALLGHDDYFAYINPYNDPHSVDKDFLTRLHENAFDQWMFELEEGFNICIYGYGSKRHLLLDFADHLHESSDKKPNVIVVNGYSPNISVRDLLTAIAKHGLPSSMASKLPLQPQALLDALLAYLTTTPPSSPIYLLAHSIDSPFFRKPLFQATISTLAAHPNIRLVASADTPTFPLLWDISQRSSLRFLFHDATTFAPYTAELDPVEEVNVLLNRSGRRIGGKDGVAYVLRSLPENARNLFRILVGEQLALADSAFETHPNSPESDGMLGHSGDDMDIDRGNVTKPKRGRGRPPKKSPAPKVKVHKTPSFVGVEYRTLYHKAVEEFVCSSEMSFRTLLKEFHDHELVESRKDGLGVERLAVPFGREDLEDMLQELV